MTLNTFKYFTAGGALALFAIGCSEPVSTESGAIVPTSNPTDPSTPSPQGITPIGQGQIVFYDPTTAYGIYVADADGRRLGRISPEGALDIDPAVSRDGKRIAFSNAVPNGDDWNIYVMNADGSNRVRLTSLRGSNDRPSWSPDGKQIAFESTADLTYNQIYVSNSDGSGFTALTFSKGNSGSPEWSPDGTRILFDRDLLGFENKGIFAMNPDGTNVTQLTSGHRDWQPAWSPDGKRVAFVRELESGRELFVMNADGSDPKQLTSGITTVSDPTWAPDGTSIAFSFVSASRMCLDTEYGDGTTSYPCGYDLERVSLEGVIDRSWALRSASNAAWQR